MEDVAIIKRAVLDSGLVQEYTQAKKSAWKGVSDALEAFLDRYGFIITRVCRNFDLSNYRRKQRCRNKTESAITGGQGYFITLTFKDDILSSTSEKTRRRYVNRQLKAVSRVYLANIDYGTKNQREHYHAIIQADEAPDLKWWTEHCGFVKVEKIGNTKTDLEKVARYTAKLSRHALKKSTQKSGVPKAPRLIYSRKAY